jgi:hypothetical protein
MTLSRTRRRRYKIRPAGPGSESAFNDVLIQLINERGRKR